MIKLDAYLLTYYIMVHENLPILMSEWVGWLSILVKSGKFNLKSNCFSNSTDTSLVTQQFN
jgi:hypothetical protein